LNGFRPNPITIPTIDATQITRLKPKPNACSIIGYHSPLLMDFLSGASASRRQTLIPLSPPFEFAALYQKFTQNGRPKIHNFKMQNKKLPIVGPFFLEGRPYNWSPEIG